MADEQQSNALASLLLSVYQQPQPQSGLTLQPYRIDGRVYKNNAIALDGYTFVNCVFIDCHLTTVQANFRFTDCHLQNCKVFFSGDALRSVRLSSVLINNWDHLPEGLRAKVEPDWGFTIE